MTEVHLSTRHDCIYAAGLFDGEGSAVLTLKKITNRRDADNPYRSVVLVASISNTYLPVLLWVKELWGGTVSSLERSRPQNHKPAFMWSTNSKNAGLFLMDIAPFVRIKREQIENALALQATKRRRGSTRPSEAEWHTAMIFLRRQRELNRRGTGEIGEVSSEAHGNK